MKALSTVSRSAPKAPPTANEKGSAPRRPRPGESFGARLEALLPARPLGAQGAAVGAAPDPKRSARDADREGPSRERRQGWPDGSALPAGPPLDALREPGPACFTSASPAVPAPPLGTVSATVVDPGALAAVAEQVLRSLRVGADAQGRSLVQLDVAVGVLAGCRIELRHISGGVEVQVRDETGAVDPRERAVVQALRRRGIEVV